MSTIRIHHYLADTRTEMPRGIKEGEPIGQGIAGQSQHAAELSGTEYTDVHGSLLYTPSGRGSGLSSTVCVCSLRKASTAASTLASCRPTICAANRPALVAPALLMASVPTAIPPGICTMESSESSPLSALDSTGTPSTGSAVCEATMPGRWAAPPAPATMTCKPRSAAVLA